MIIDCADRHRNRFIGSSCRTRCRSDGKEQCWRRFVGRSCQSQTRSKPRTRPTLNLYQWWDGYTVLIGPWIYMHMHVFLTVQKVVRKATSLNSYSQLIQNTKFYFAYFAIFWCVLHISVFYKYWSISHPFVVLLCVGFSGQVNIKGKLFIRCIYEQTIAKISILFQIKKYGEKLYNIIRLLQLYRDHISAILII